MSGSGVRVYVAGPLTHGDVLHNIRDAAYAATMIADAGGAPMLPHTSALWHLMFPRNHPDWMRIDLAWVEVAHAVYRLEGYSPGAELEVDCAMEKGIPVFWDMSELLEWLSDQLDAEELN